MEELVRLSRRVKYARLAGPLVDGAYQLDMWFKGSAKVCAMTGAILEYVTLGGRIFRGPDVQIEHDRIVDRWLIDHSHLEEQWQSCFAGLSVDDLAPVLDRHGHKFSETTLKYVVGQLYRQDRCEER